MRVLAVGVSAAVVVALPVPAFAGGGHRAELRAKVQRASYGVPHITADSFAGLGYGVGHVQAEDNLCVIADRMVTVDAQRARFLGGTPENVRSDLFYQKAKDDRIAERWLDGRQDGVHAPTRQARDLVRGFVAGYNTYLRRNGTTDPACTGRPWLRPLTELDMWRANWASIVRGSSRALLDGIVAATPPAAAAPAAPAAVAPAAPVAAAAASPQIVPDPQVLSALTDPLAKAGSNAYGLGRGATAGDGGMVLANPHFPWDGAERFYRMHLRIPGVYDVEGAALIGDPIIEIGHNATLGWSHTVSTARRFVWHRLTLVPGDPTSYVVDGRPERMTRRDVTAAGVTKTFYDTRYGPVVVVPGSFPWTTTTAFAITDANTMNNRTIDGWLKMGQARTIRDLRAVLDRHQFLPWVNVIAADSQGTALYGDHSVVPRVTDDLADTCIDAPFKDLYAGTGQAVLDGSRSACALGADRDAAVPGILGPERLPVLVRNDYVTNSNDSYWLANPEQPLTGYPRIIGNEGTPRSLRTRVGLDQVQRRIAGTDGLPGRGFTPRSLWDVTFGNRVYGGELVRDDLVRLCTANPVGTATNGAAVDLTAACGALRRWDLKADVDSRGTAVFREFALAGGILFGDAMTDPVRTPRRLAVDDPRVRTALADAVQRLAGIPLDAPLGSVQTEPRGAQRIPIHGDVNQTGTFNVITAPLVAGVGYPKVVHGTSFVMAVHFGRGGPSGRQILTYSQSSNPNSPWYADQTRLYSGKGYDTVKYTGAQLRADRNVRTYYVSEPR